MATNQLSQQSNRSFIFKIILAFPIPILTKIFACKLYTFQVVCCHIPFFFSLFFVVLVCRELVVPMGGGTGGTRPPQKICKGDKGGHFLGEKTSSFNQYGTILAYI